MSENVPGCRCCGKLVAVWRDEAPEQAICMDCCATADHPDGEHGHQFEYERDNRAWECRYCAAPADNDFYDYLNSLGSP